MGKQVLLRSMFQFPIRNSVRSDSIVDIRIECPLNNVSIPHSEFCSFGPRWFFLLVVSVESFNSPFGILFVRTLFCVARNSRHSPCFNSPFGILFVRTSRVVCICFWHSHSFNSPFGILFVRTNLLPVYKYAYPRRFNSPFGILFVRTMSSSSPSSHCKPVSIPHSEFCSFGHNVRVVGMHVQR